MTPEPRTITITARVTHGFVRDLVEEMEARLREVDPEATVVHDALDHGEEPAGRIVLDFRGPDLPDALGHLDDRLADWFYPDHTENAMSEDPVEKSGEPGVFVVAVRLMEPTEAVDASMVSRAVSECLPDYPDDLRWSGTWQPPGGDPALAEIERDLIRERTQAGLAAARARGRTGGRPAVMTPDKLRVSPRASRRMTAHHGRHRPHHRRQPHQPLPAPPDPNRRCLAEAVDAHKTLATSKSPRHP